MSRFLLLALLALAPACATTTAATAPAAQPASPVVATYDGQIITLAEVDKRAGDDLFELQEKLFELRTDTAERVALEALVTQRAKKEGVPEEAWVEARIEKGVVEPTDAQLEELFEKVKDRLESGTDLDAIKPQLRQLAMREGRAKNARALFDELKAASHFTLVLEGPSRPRKQVEAVGPSRGDATARVTIVEFADFQCPFCARAAGTVDRVVSSYGGKVRLVFRHFPLSAHTKAPKASEGAACADEQGRFWDFHDVLFADTTALDVDQLKGHAGKLGLDQKRFDECLDSGRMAQVVMRDLKAGEALGVRGTPAFFVNGVMLSGAQPEEDFKKLIDAELNKP